MSLYIYTENTELKQMLIEQVQKHRWTDSGFDIPLLHSIFESRNVNYPIKLGIKVAAMSGDQTRPCLLLPRSSIGSTAFRITNSLGLIDQGYRGEVQAKVDIINPNGASVLGGTRLFQICQHNFLPWESVIVVSSEDELPKAPDARGDGGFGSTGR